MKMNIKNYVWVLYVIIFSSFFSCENRTSKIVFHLPENFTGVIFLEKISHVKSDAHPIDPIIDIEIPDSGVLATPYYNYFSEWHAIEVQVQSNDKLLNLYELGEVDGERLVFFYGTETEYEAHVKYVSPIDLKSGRCAWKSKGDEHNQ